MKQLSSEALEVLDSGVTVDRNRRELRITAGQLDRKLYVEINAALEALGGKWNRKAKAHLFEEDPFDAIDQVLVDGGFHDRKRDFQQFFTPEALANEVVRRALVRGHRVLEPSAGHGALALAAHAAGASYVQCVEKDPKCAAVLKALDLPCPIEADFLEWSTDWRWTRIIMNPPFSRQQDIDHVLRAYSLLASGGQLVAIMSAGVIFRDNRKGLDFRSFIDRSNGIVTSLPDGAFKESGTLVRAVIVELTKA